MVLEEVNRTSPSAYDNNDTFSSTDTAPADSSSSGSPSTTHTYNLDVSQLATGLPILGPLTGFTEQRRIATIHHSLSAVQKLIRRPLRDEEVQAVAFHTAKGLSIASYGQPLGIAGGLWRANNSKGTYRFPFVQPDLEKLNPEKLGPLKGEIARKGWHVLRAAAYGAIGGWVGRTIVAGYAATVAATGQRMDKRMSDIVDAIGKMGRDEAGKRARDSVKQGPAAAGQAQQQGGQDADSPSYGAYTPTSAGETAYGASGNSTDDGLLGNSYTRTQSEQAQQQSSYSRPSQSSSSSMFDFDDASPTAGPDPRDSQNANETAWERLRRGGGRQGDRPSSSSPSPQARQNAQQQSQNASGDAWSAMRRGGDVQAEQRQGSTLGDSFSFADGSESERRIERERAQREFDERVERERRGEEFGGGGNGRKW